MRSSLAIAITDESRVAQARRCAVALAEELEFGVPDAGRVALVATEAATNLSKHAQKGELVIRTAGNAVEILALDRGPGMANLDQCMGDGYSTAGSPGTGLGAIRRVSSSFDIHSVPGRGTTLVAHIRPANSSAKQNGASQGRVLDVSGICVPKPGEEVSGDAWAVSQSKSRALLLAVDGLGHGPDAARASAEAVRTFGEVSDRSPVEIIEAIHGALRSTRGAAVAVAEADIERRLVHYAGLGNISGVIQAPGESRQMVSHHGIAGHQLSRLKAFSYAWPEEALIILHSDGLISHWGLDPYPGLVRRHSSLIAAVLYRDFSRGRDDVMVMVARKAGQTQ
jgi:anti-sigma regulatory factor (Ser/Thr protein kinase)